MSGSHFCAVHRDWHQRGRRRWFYGYGAPYGHRAWGRWTDDLGELSVFYLVVALALAAGRVP